VSAGGRKVGRKEGREGRRVGESERAPGGGGEIVKEEKERNAAFAGINRQASSIR
jgi:hypothetical protein